MAHLLARDYERMIDLATSVFSQPAGESPWQAVLEELVRALHGTVGVLSEVWWASGYGRVHAWTPASLGSKPLDSALRSHIKRGHPLARHYALTDDLSPLAITDVIDERAWRASETYAATRELFGSERHFAVPLPAADSGSRLYLVVHRNGRNFTDRERDYARRLQPLLFAMGRHFRTMSQCKAAGKPGDIDGAMELGLTHREIGVLVLLAESLTAEGIGRRLGISARTVHKHLEGLYRKLGTTDRLATVLRAQALGLLRAHGTVMIGAS